MYSADHLRLRMTSLLNAMTTRQGMVPTAIDGVKLFRVDRSYPRAPVLYEPSIVILASGRKSAFLGGRHFTFDPAHYLVLSVPLPFEVETFASPEEPNLGLSIRIDLATLAELTHASRHFANQVQPRRGGSPAPGAPAQPLSMQTTPLDPTLSAAGIRLLEALQTPLDAAILGPGLVREIVFRVLQGAQSSLLWSLLDLNGPLAQIHSALDHIHHAYATPIDVPGLAATAHMSTSAFHHTFKHVTGTSPLQYLKNLRLHKARLLIAHDGLGAALAANRVGYESPSQFSREFKRFFGRTPTEELTHLRGGSDYVPLGSAMLA